MAKITLIGMYSWDDTLFDNLTVPEGIEKDILIESIMLRGGEFEVIYPDFDFLKYSIGSWSCKYQPTMERWIRVLTEEYDPLENYDRIESWTDGESGSQSGSSSDTLSGTTSGTSSDTTSGTASGNTSGTTGSTTTNKVSAYDAGDTLTTRDLSEVHASDSSSSSSTTSGTASGTTSETVSETRGGTTSGQYSKSLTRSGSVHGNIGVMSSQNMLLQELDVGYRNIYNMLTDLFLTEFVLPIY